MRWTAIILLVVSGLVLVFMGLLVPAHFRAVDADVLHEAARSADTLVDVSIEQVRAGQMGVARLMFEASQAIEVGGAVDLEKVLRQFDDLKNQQGEVAELNMILSGDPRAVKWDGQPVTQLFSKPEARSATRHWLGNAVRSGVLEILKTEGLTNLVYFSPAGSAAGQPFEGACLLTALLVQQELLPDGLRNEVESLAYAATRKGQTQVLELFYLDMISLGNRMNWGQLLAFLATVDGVNTLRDLSNLIRHYKEKWQVLAAAVLWQGEARFVTRYLLMHAKTGQKDLVYAMRHGRTGVNQLIGSQRRIYDPGWRKALVQYDPFFSVYATWLRVASESRTWAMVLKYGLLVLGTFFLSRAVIDLMPVAEGIAVKRWASPAHWALFGAMLVLFWACFEPFVFQQTQTLNFPLNWKLPMVGETLRQTISNKLKPMMDTLTIVALVFFLVLQGVIYLMCLLKLADIRRQPVSSEVKLRLLENEENLFDAGLYCGLGGTVFSLVMLAMGILKPSLMAAYASTLFGIIFVALLKICHLRPFRRRLIMDAES